MSMSSRRGASAAAGTQSPVRTWRTWRRLVPVLPVSAVLVLAACSGGAGSPALARQVSGQPPPPCSANPPQEAPPLHPTTVTTIGQAYYCIFAHYYAGPVLDDRVLLAAAFAGFTQELDQLGMDQPDATMPALTGNRDRDWNAFAAVYQKVTSQLPASPAQRQELAAATMTALVASLDNNHAQWSYPAPPPGTVPGDLGIMTSPAPPLADIAPQEALPPLFITAVPPASPAASAGLRPGDIIVSVNGAPPFTDGIISEGVMNLLFGPDPQPGRLIGAAAAARHRPHLDSDPDTRALPAAPAARGIRQAAGRGHRLRAAARVLPRRGRPGAAGDSGHRRQAARGHPGPARQRRRLTRRGLPAARRLHPWQGLRLRLRRARQLPRHLHRHRRPAAAPAAGRADRPQLRLSMRRVQRRRERPAARHPGRHQDGGPRGRPRRPLPARRRQPDHPPGQARAQRRPRADQRHRRRTRTTTSRSPRTTCPPGTTPTSPRRSPCSAATRACQRHASRRACPCPAAEKTEKARACFVSRACEVNPATGDRPRRQRRVQDGLS